MRTRNPALLQALEERNISHSNLAKALGIGRIKLFLKLRGLKPWELPEMVYICRILADSDVQRLFH